MPWKFNFPALEITVISQVSFSPHSARGHQLTKNAYI